MKRILILASSMFLLLFLHSPTVAPTDAQLGSRRGQDVEGYNVVNSFEMGYRWRDVDGNLGKYRSDVNFGNGVPPARKQSDCATRRKGTGNTSMSCC